MRCSGYKATFIESMFYINAEIPILHKANYTPQSKGGSTGHRGKNLFTCYSTSTSTSTLFQKTIGYNRLARKIAIANLGGPVKRKIN